MILLNGARAFGAARRRSADFAGGVASRGDRRVALGVAAGAI